MTAGQGRVETVGAQMQAPGRKPSGDFPHHRFAQVQERFFPLAVQPHIDRQAQGFPAPGRIDPHAQPHQIQAETVHHPLRRGADRIAPPAGPFHLPPGLVEGRIVKGQRDRSLRMEPLDQAASQSLPEMGHAPGACAEEPMVGVVSLLALRFGQRIDTRQRMPPRTQHPADRHAGEQYCGRLVEASQEQGQQRRPRLGPAVHAFLRRHWAIPAKA